MAETYSTQDKSLSTSFLLGNRSRQVRGWEDLIALAKERIASLNAVIEVFQKYQETDEPFIDERESTEGKVAA